MYGGISANMPLSTNLGHKCVPTARNIQKKSFQWQIATTVNCAFQRMKAQKAVFVISSVNCVIKAPVSELIVIEPM